MTITEPGAAYPLDAAPAAESSRLRRIGKGLTSVARRSPLSAFWGCIAAAIIVMALAAPVFAP